MTERRRKPRIGLFDSARTLAAGLTLGAILAVVLGAALSPLFGIQIRTVLSGSMAPTINTGDALLVERVRAREVRVGDVITFTDPTDRSRLITHRVSTLRFDGKRANVTTKGDANTGVERWGIEADGTVGLVRQRLPRFGYVFAWAQSPLGRVLLVVFPALLWLAFELRRIWARQERADAQLTLF